MLNNKKNNLKNFLVSLVMAVAIVLFLAGLGVLTPEPEVIIQSVEAEVKETAIIDEENLLDVETENYIRDNIVPLANKHFDVETMTFSSTSESGRIAVDMIVSNESLGRLLSQKVASIPVQEQRESFREEMKRNIPRVSELLYLKIGKTVIQLSTPDMGSSVFIRTYGQEEFQVDHFGFTEIYEWEE